MPPPAVSPDQILDYAPRGHRIVRVEANVAAYFADMFAALRQTLICAPRSGPLNTGRKAPSNTASAQNRS
jgi:hypothetical protein